MKSPNDSQPRNGLRLPCRRLLLASSFLALLSSCSSQPVAVDPPRLPDLPARLAAPLPAFPDLQTLPDGSSTVGMVVEWGTTARVLYQQALDRAADLIKFYESLRQPEKKP